MRAAFGIRDDTNGKGFGCVLWGGAFLLIFLAITIGVVASGKSDLKEQVTRQALEDSLAGCQTEVCRTNAQTRHEACARATRRGARTGRYHIPKDRYDYCISNGIEAHYARVRKENKTETAPATLKP